MTTNRSDREETKRLLHVALTRARDRLYLGSAVKRVGFSQRAAALVRFCRRLSITSSSKRRGVSAVSWSGASRTHVIGVCATSGLRQTTILSTSTAKSQRPRTRRLCCSRRRNGPAICGVSTVGGRQRRQAIQEGHDESSDRLIGILVHRPSCSARVYQRELGDEEIGKLAETVLSSGNTTC